MPKHNAHVGSYKLDRMTTRAHMLYSKASQSSAIIAPVVAPKPARKPNRSAKGIEVRRAYMKDIRRKARILGIAESGKGYCARVNAMWTAHLATVELAAYNYADRTR